MRVAYPPRPTGPWSKLQHGHGTSYMVVDPEAERAAIDEWVAECNRITADRMEACVAELRGIGEKQR